MPHWQRDVTSQPWHLPCGSSWTTDRMQTAIRRAVLKHARGTRIHVMDTLQLAAHRSDAHPGSLRNERYDCLHWCLPGVPDVWNAVLFNYLC